MGASLNERETLEQIALGGTVRVATTSICIAAVGAATSGAGLAAGAKACAVAGTAAGQIASRSVDVGTPRP